MLTDARSLKNSPWRAYLWLLITPFLCHCSFIQQQLPLQDAPSHDTEDLKQLTALSHLAQADWHLAQAELLEKEAQPTPRNLTSQYKRFRNLNRQKQTAKNLLKACLALNLAEELVIGYRCSQTLQKLPLSEDQEREVHRIMMQFKAIKNKLSKHLKTPRPSNTKAQNLDISSPDESDAILESLQQAIKQSDLLAAQALRQKLPETTDLTPQQQQTAQKLQRLYRQQVLSLDLYADQLYQHESITEAHAIWALLLKLDAKNPDITNKYKRAQKVLENLNELRQDGHTREQPL